MKELSNYLLLNEIRNEEIWDKLEIYDSSLNWKAYREDEKACLKNW